MDLIKHSNIYRYVSKILSVAHKFHIFLYLFFLAPISRYMDGDVQGDVSKGAMSCKEDIKFPKHRAAIESSVGKLH